MRKSEQPNFDIYEELEPEKHLPYYGKRLFPDIGKITWELWASTLSKQEIKELLKEMTLYVLAMDYQEERGEILSKYDKDFEKLKANPADQKRYEWLFNELMELPHGEDQKDREAKQLICEATKLLKQKKQSFKSAIPDGTFPPQVETTTVSK